MDLEIRGKAAVVTGGSRGMGRAVAARLAAEGAKVCIVARRRDVADEAAREIAHSTGSEVMAFAGDVKDADLPARLLREITAQWQQVDILVNNAGGPPMGSFLDMSESDWNEALQQNLCGVIRSVRAFAPGMKERRWGRIVNITSTLAKEPAPAMVLSATARAAVSAFSKAVSQELAAFNVTINTVCPGGVRTDRLEALIRQRAEQEKIPVESLFESRQGAIPIKRFAEPEEIADVIAFLASERSAYITGTSIVVDGGLTKGIF